MALVSYSDSEDSEKETEVKKAPNPEQPKTEQDHSTSKPGFQSFVNRLNPRKIKVALPETKDTSSRGESEDGPPAKKARLGGGGGAFSGFNAMLPAPKKPQQSGSNKSSEGLKGQPRKVFSLKTGAAPGFDRNADAEFGTDLGRSDASNGHADNDDIGSSMQNEPSESGDTNGTGLQKSFKAPSEPAIKGNPMMFKPLSVARKPQKKKPASTMALEKALNTSTIPTAADPKPPPKASLFSLGNTQDTSPVTNSETSSTDYQPFIYESTQSTLLTEDDDPEDSLDNFSAASPPKPSAIAPPPSASLTTIATDLNLTPAERRLLLGRSGGKNSPASAINIVNFNTDAEYAANEAFRAAGDQVQHNPVRSIAPGKHSLKQLVNAASNQKDALEEAFASGKRNKKEAGNRYGW